MLKRCFQILVVGSAIGLAGSIARADMFTLSSATSPFTPGVFNNGWWSATATNFDTNSSYLVGQTGGDLIRNFSTFDLAAAIPSGQRVVSATFRMLFWFNSGLNDATETLEFFDVTTDAATLNHNVGTSAAIFDDLGSGTSYGSFVVPGHGGSADVFSFVLNANAIADINAGLNGFFSIGGDLTSQDGNEFFFAASTSANVLDIVTEAIPAPSATVLGLIGLVLAGMAKRRVA